MDRDQFIEEAKKTGLPDSAIQEILDIHERSAHDGNPMPYSLEFVSLSDNDISFTNAKDHISVALT